MLLYVTAVHYVSIHTLIIIKKTSVTCSNYMVKYNKYIVTCAVTWTVTCGNMCSTYLKFVYIISHTIPSIIIITIYCYNEILSTTLLHKGVHSRTQSPSYARSTERDKGLWPNPYQTGIWLATTKVVVLIPDIFYYHVFMVSGYGFGQSPSSLRA